MCTILRMPDGQLCETMGELMDWQGPLKSIPIDRRYTDTSPGRDWCLCPVDLPALAKMLNTTIDDNDEFETHLNGGDNG